MTSVDLLQRLAKSWNKRSRVCSNLNLDIAFDKEKDDFLVELLPFKDHPSFISISPAMRSKILSCGWIVYNAKTIAIETHIVHPTCMAMLDDQFNGVSDFLSKQLITETLIDESYHIHLCTYGNEITKYHRNINVKLPFFGFVKKMQKLQDNYLEKWKKMIIQLVTSITTEIYITDYLALVSKQHTHPIQPLNSLIVKTHRFDELVHGKIFTHIAKSIFYTLDRKQQAFFAEIMPKPIAWLTDLELNLWLSLLKQIEFPQAEKMINECRILNDEKNQNLPQLKDSILDLLALAQELGVMDLSIGKESFHKEHIM